MPSFRVIGHSWNKRSVLSNQRFWESVSHCLNPLISQCFTLAKVVDQGSAHFFKDILSPYQAIYVFACRSEQKVTKRRRNKHVCVHHHRNCGHLPYSLH